jgi:alanyl aminopeptidase
MIAVANSPIVAEESGGDGMKVVRFEETQPLPSYLIAFAVGPWQIVDAGSVGHRPTPLRFIAPRGRTPDLDFVAHAYPELFAQEERWFGTAYPFAKLDQIAIPLTVRFAMENAGLITYGAANILRPDSATPSFRHGAANVGAHEMAHQWFGNLVTMRWWDDIWLNEAFATWLTSRIEQQNFPDWNEDVAAVSSKSAVMGTDTLLSARKIRQPIMSEGDIGSAFDDITYQKGAAVIRMFENYVGPEQFRNGIQNYLRKHQWGNATAVLVISQSVRFHSHVICPV